MVVAGYEKTIQKTITGTAGSFAASRHRTYWVLADTACRIAADLTAAVAATGYETCGAVVANDTVVINGVTFTCIDIAATPTNDQFCAGASSAATAVNLAAAVNASTSAGVADIAATIDGSVAEKVVFTAKTLGTAGNAYTLSTSTHFTRSGATLAAGAFVTTTTGLPIAANVPEFVRFGATAAAAPTVYFVGTSGTLTLTPADP